MSVSHIVEEAILETGLIEKGVVIIHDTGVEITLDMGLIEEGVELILDGVFILTVEIKLIFNDIFTWKEIGEMK